MRLFLNEKRIIPKKFVFSCHPLNIEKSKARWAKWNALATYACKLSSENYANLATV